MINALDPFLINFALPELQNKLFLSNSEVWFWYLKFLYAYHSKNTYCYDFWSHLQQRQLTTLFLKLKRFAGDKSNAQNSKNRTV